MRWVVALALLFLASAAQAQVSPVPPIIAGTLDLGTGTTVQAGALNGWGIALAAEDQSGTPTAAGSGYAAGDTITLNDGCSTHIVVAVQAVNSGAISSYYITKKGVCAQAPTSPVAQLSTSGAGTGATFPITVAPYASTLVLNTSASGNFFLSDSVQADFYGTEGTFVGHGAGGAFSGASDFDTATGLNACGIGGGAGGVVGNSITCTGTDDMRNLHGTGLNSLDGYGSGTLANLNANNLSSWAAFGAGAMAYIKAGDAPANNLAAGTGACAGNSSSIATNYISRATCLGGGAAPNVTDAANFIVVGSAVGQTITNQTDFLLIGDGQNAVEPPAGSLPHDFINILNMIEATGIGTPASSIMWAAGDWAAGGNAALATTATSGFNFLSHTAGTPTGTPANGAGACTLNTASNTLDCYNGTGWYHVSLTSGAN